MTKYTHETGPPIVDIDSLNGQNIFKVIFDNDLGAGAGINF